MISPDIDFLKTMLQYDPLSGAFTWLVSRPGRAKGATAGSPNNKGYLQIGHKGSLLKAHRLAYAFMTGEWPSGQIDHVNGVNADNRWCNLRRASPDENQWNTRTRQDNELGLKGVRRIASTGKYQARIRRCGIRVSLGMFASAQEAKKARDSAAARIHGEYARHE